MKSSDIEMELFDYLPDSAVYVALIKMNILLKI